MYVYKIRKYNPPKLVPWSTGTDDEIKAMVDAYYDGVLSMADIQSVWHIGDTRNIYIDEQEAMGTFDTGHAAGNIQYAILNFGGKVLSSDHKTEVLAVLGAVNGINGKMHSTRTNVGGWEQCDRRTWCNTIYKNAFPSSFVRIIKQFDNPTTEGNKSSTIVVSADYFALPSASEALNIITEPYCYEGKLFAYFKDFQNKKRWAPSSGVIVTSTWLLRSPTTTLDTAYRIVSSAKDNGGTSSGYANTTYRIHPIFCI